MSFFQSHTKNNTQMAPNACQEDLVTPRCNYLLYSVTLQNFFLIFVTILLIVGGDKMNKGPHLVL